MQYALVNGQRHMATPKLNGLCPACGARALAKCGHKVIWHWAHAGKRHCDPWWENETPWHRRWKSYFPEPLREVVHFDQATGEKHVADVKTGNAVVIEFQNSPMDPAELRSREAFYGKMTWIVNAAPFKERFHILSALPDPRCEFAQDLVFWPQSIDALGKNFWRKSENPGHESRPNALVEVHSIKEIEPMIAKNYLGHHLFDWTRPRDVWYGASAPLFFDFGGDILWRMLAYDDRGLRCVRRVHKRDLVAENGGEYAPLPDAPE